jgi:hypothetical protein
MGIYLSPDAMVTTALLIGVWTLLALAVGVGIGKAIALADQRQADDSTWLDDVPDGRTDTTELVIPSAWFKPGTFDELA